MKDTEVIMYESLFLFFVFLSLLAVQARSEPGVSDKSILVGSSVLGQLSMPIKGPDRKLIRGDFCVVQYDSVLNITRRSNTDVEAQVSCKAKSQCKSCDFMTSYNMRLPGQQRYNGENYQAQCESLLGAAQVPGNYVKGPSPNQQGLSRTWDYAEANFQSFPLCPKGAKVLVTQSALKASYHSLEIIGLEDFRSNTQFSGSYNAHVSQVDQRPKALLQKP